MTPKRKTHISVLLFAFIMMFSSCEEPSFIDGEDEHVLYPPDKFKLCAHFTVRFDYKYMFVTFEEDAAWKLTTSEYGSITLYNSLEHDDTGRGFYKYYYTNITDKVVGFRADIEYEFKLYDSDLHEGNVCITFTKRDKPYDKAELKF